MNKEDLVLDVKYGIQDFLYGLNYKLWPIWWLIGPVIRRRRKPYLSYCPHCHFDGFDFYEEPYFECTNGGSYGSLDGTIYWFEGIQQCPRCHHKFEVYDSS